MIQGTSSCSQYTQGLEGSSPKVTRSCKNTMEGPDDVIFDTTIRDDSLVTQYGFTCDAHAITQVRILRSFLIITKIRTMLVTINIHEHTCLKRNISRFMQQSSSLEYYAALYFLVTSPIGSAVNWRLYLQF